MKNLLSFILVLNFLISCQSIIDASEVIPETNSKVVVREHPKTGKPYVVIASNDFQNQSFFPNSQKFSRPDYRLLDPKVKSGEIPYDGPYSDSKRIYIFAASLATLGTVGGAIGLAVLPASTGVAATGGGAYLAAGSAVAAGTAGATVIKSKSDPHKDDFTQASESKSIYKSSSERS